MMTIKKFFTISILHTIALMAVLCGAVGSLGLMLYTGRHNDSVLLLLLFATWVLSPFIALLVANVVSKRWLVLTRVTLYCLMLVITLGSLVSYSGALSPPGTKPAFVFLAVPLISWLLMAIVIPIAASLSRRLSRKSDSV
jgi:hypothetical protein